jgi:2-C-methyl-D-erythritol 4-phosphate cytidylyltransferase
VTAYWLVMPAAGSGRRFGAGLPKQYAPLAGRTVIEWSLAPFLDDPRCLGIRVAVAPTDAHWSTLRLQDAGGRLRTVAGGGRRCDSVRLALAGLPAGPADWVLVHDAARPCLDTRDLDSLLAAAEGGADGALLAQPLADTLKRADDAGRAVATVERAGLWRAQTPQMFRLGQLAEALALCEARGLEPTDEAQAIELLGLRPRLVCGRATNLKLTAASDLELAASILGQGEHRTC